MAATVQPGDSGSRYCFGNKQGILMAGQRKKVWQIIKFIGFFIWQLLLSNLRVAYEVVTPPHTMRPAIVAVP
ncbi:MAG: hypothetical protein D3918_16305, partial [Candidatus Electrothrix sp. AX2]|nr:hypothetical protein [Candidatus Electrothrix gigas]